MLVCISCPHPSLQDWTDSGRPACSLQGLQVGAFTKKEATLVPGPWNSSEGDNEEANLSGFLISKKSKIEDILPDIEVTYMINWFDKIPLIVILLLKKKKIVLGCDNTGLSLTKFKDIMDKTHK